MIGSRSYAGHVSEDEIEPGALPGAGVVERCAIGSRWKRYEAFGSRLAAHCDTSDAHGCPSATSSGDVFRLDHEERRPAARNKA